MKGLSEEINLDNNFSDFKIGAIVYTYIATESFSQVNCTASSKLETKSIIIVKIENEN
jgi:hypothetical protein